MRYARGVVSIVKKITEYVALNPSRFHTPGHKGTLHPFDITELVDDSFPAQVVEVAEKEVASLYGAKHLRFLTGGSSIGIKAAILAAAGDVIAFKGHHQALSEGASLAKVNLYTHDTGYSIEGLPKVVTVQEVTLAIANNPTAKAVYIESPDYWGRVVSKDVGEAIRAAGKFFFCDAAHGAHFMADTKVFPHCFASLADVCNLSAHKTLNAYTQTAYLCVNHQALIAPITTALKNLGTTSPNYMLLASLESAAHEAKHNALAYKRLKEDILHFKKCVPCLAADDCTRISVDAVALGLSGQALNAKLVAKNIFAEKVGDRYVTFIATVHEKFADFEALAQAIKTSASINKN